MDIATLLDVALVLVDQNEPDVEAVLELLDRLPRDTFDVQTRGAIAHAQMVTAAALNQSSAHTAIARFALFRVARLLEQRVPVTI